MIDSRSAARLAQVHPWLSHLITDLYERLIVEGIELHVVQGLRTYEEQDALYAQGRTAEGAIVTNAKAGYSWHNFGCAVDVAPFAEHQPDWNAAHPSWARIIELGELVGLKSGKSWHDLPHFQLPQIPATPTGEHRLLYVDKGLEAVWSSFRIK